MTVWFPRRPTVVPLFSVREVRYRSLTVYWKERNTAVISAASCRLHTPPAPHRKTHQTKERDDNTLEFLELATPVPGGTERWLAVLIFLGGSGCRTRSLIGKQQKTEKVRGKNNVALPHQADVRHSVQQGAAWARTCGPLLYVVKNTRTALSDRWRK